MSQSSHEVAAQIEGRRAEVEAELQALMRLQRTVSADIAKVDAEVEPAWDTFTAIAVPDLERRSLEAVARRVHLTALSPDEVYARRERTRVAAEQRLAALRADPRVVEHDTRTNALDIQILELDEAIAPLEASVRVLEMEPMFPELLAHRYGSDEYAIRFWQLNYYKHWKHGDLIVEVHGPRLKQVDFKGIVGIYLDEKRSLETLQGERRRRREEKKAIADLLAAKAEVEALLGDLDGAALKAVRTRLKEYLRAVPPADVFRLFADDDASTIAFKRVAGTARKRDYLRALDDEQLKGTIGELRTMKGKYDRTRAKMLRPKNSHVRWSNDQVQRMLGRPRGDKWQKRRSHWNDARERVVGFHHYDRYDPVGQLLWWDVMTDGQLDGNFISEVRERGPVRYTASTSSPTLHSSDDWRGDDLADVS